MICFSVGKELDNLEHPNNNVDLKELGEYTVSGASVGHQFKSLWEVYLCAVMITLCFYNIPFFREFNGI